MKSLNYSYLTQIKFLCLWEFPFRLIFKKFFILSAKGKMKAWFDRAVFSEEDEKINLNVLGRSSPNGKTCGVDIPFGFAFQDIGQK